MVEFWGCFGSGTSLRWISCKFRRNILNKVCVCVLKPYPLWWSQSIRYVPRRHLSRTAWKEDSPQRRPRSTPWPPRWQAWRACPADTCTHDLSKPAPLRVLRPPAAPLTSGVMWPTGSLTSRYFLFSSNMQVGGLSTCIYFLLFLQLFARRTALLMSCDRLQDLGVSN